MKKMTTIGALLALIALPSAALAQTGYYGWAISASNTDPAQTTPTNPGSGVHNLYLWFLEGCNPQTPPGIQAAEFDLTNGGSDWQILAFNTMNGFLNAGGATNLLLATPCVSTARVAGSILVNSPTGAPGRVGMTLSAANNKAVAVDCQIFSEIPWPQFMRFRGYATSDNAQPAQDHGADCSTVSVEDESWGAVKALYR